MRERQPQADDTQWLSMSEGFPGGSVVKNLPANAGDSGLIPGWGRSPGEGNGNPTPVFLPGESHGQRNVAGYNPCLKELDLTSMHARNG